MVDLENYKNDTLEVDIIKDLGKLGSHGVYQNNVWRDLMEALPKPKLPALHELSTPMKHPVLGLFFKPTYMLLPHELFAAIFTYFPEMWTKSIYTVEKCRSFWNSVRGGAHFLSHPVRFREDHSTACVALKLHGDGTPAVGIGKSWGKMVNIWSISSMLCSGPTILRNFMLWAIHQCLMSVLAGHHTANAFWKRLEWSMLACWEGKWPTRDWNGKPMRYSKAGTPLCGGIFFCIWALIGDLDYLTKDLELPNSTSNSPCALCPCNATDLAWWHFMADAAWLKKIYDILTWKAAGWDTCGVFQIVGVTVLSVYPDWMHCKHLGTDKVLHGSMLWMLVHWVLGGSAEQNLQIVFKDVERIYKEDKTPNRFGQIKMTMFTTRSQPKLKGKAGEIKDFGPVLHKIWKAYMNERIALHRQMEFILRLSNHMDTILDEHTGAFTLPKTAADDLISTGWACFTEWYQVAMWCKDEGHALMGLTAKAHWLMHCCLLSRCLSLGCLLYLRGVFHYFFTQVPCPHFEKKYAVPYTQLCHTLFEFSRNDHLDKHIHYTHRKIRNC